MPISRVYGIYATSSQVGDAARVKRPFGFPERPLSQKNQLLKAGPMQISVVIPAYNEEGNIGRLVSETFAAIPHDMVGEVIVVDDFSTDGTAAEITELKQQNPKLRLVRHLSNAGQSASVRTGILAARFP
ncbi:MAG TPA: glycosyltransferase family 2 protein, partial [Rhizobiaceae bacterium]|nr:glycosyltransferase family 2 protein [Rhizobiaceae bacterium]